MKTFEWTLKSHPAAARAIERGAAQEAQIFVVITPPVSVFPSRPLRPKVAAKALQNAGLVADEQCIEKEGVSVRRQSHELSRTMDQAQHRGCKIMGHSQCQMVL
jgi:hypothetical protein